MDKIEYTRGTYSKEAQKARIAQVRFGLQPDNDQSRVDACHDLLGCDSPSGHRCIVGGYVTAVKVDRGSTPHS